MLGGGNRGWGVGNEPSRSLRGSGVVARLLRSELCAEHLSLSRLERHCSSIEDQRDRAGGAPPERTPSPRAIRLAVEPRAGLARTVGCIYWVAARDRQSSGAGTQTLQPSP